MNKEQSRLRVKQILWESFSRYLFIDVKLSSSRKSKEKYFYEFKRIAKYFSDVDFTRDNFTDYIYQLKQEGLSASTLNNLIKLSKHLDRFLKTNILTDYTFFKEQLKVVDALTPLEIHSMAELEIPYRYYPKLKNTRYRALILFLGTTGCRLGEALDLDWKSVGDHLVRFYDTKNGDTRVVPISDMLYDLLQELPKDKLVFTSERGGRMNEAQVRVDFKQRAQMVGIKKEIYPHVFRHSYITEMIKSGVSISYISRIVGHKDLQSTNHYTQLVVEDLREAIYMHPLLRSSLTLEKITDRIQKVAEQLVDSSKYSLTVVKESGTLQVLIKAHTVLVFFLLYAH